ncbi:hypothetical protein NQ317_000294 [Molorchus minor]|uniref:Uncharacterized protein n=1 Tax=Molorchus minor TaxID=1323400 RepID=A0ABQ9JB51_9CUCU|nr:hypothetical protein NQ317_000294 [Molorchus minor]
MKKTSDRGWKAFDFGCDQKSNSPPTKKTKKVTVAEHSAISTQETGLTGKRKSSFNFINTVAPKSESDLAQSSPMLLISGPTGSAKSTTVNLLCNKLGISISEWVNPMDYDYDVFRSQGQISTFVEFLTESKWSSLLKSQTIKGLH